MESDPRMANDGEVFTATARGDIWSNQFEMPPETEERILDDHQSDKRPERSNIEIHSPLETRAKRNFAEKQPHPKQRKQIGMFSYVEIPSWQERSLQEAAKRRRERQKQLVNQKREELYKKLRELEEAQNRQHRKFQEDVKGLAHLVDQQMQLLDAEAEEFEVAYGGQKPIQTNWSAPPKQNPSNQK